jgi:hypothetical protein
MGFLTFVPRGHRQRGLQHVTLVSHRRASVRLSGGQWRKRATINELRGRRQESSVTGSDAEICADIDSGAEMSARTLAIGLTRVGAS